jgi:hypothetical protein
MEREIILKNMLIKLVSNALNQSKFSSTSGIGEMVLGSTSLCITNLDSASRTLTEGREAAERVVGGSYEAVASRQSLNKAGRGDFGKRVRRDLRNPEYRFLFDS